MFAYNLRHDVNVRVDILYTNWSVMRRTWVDLLGTVLILIPFTVLGIWMTVSPVLFSWGRLPDGTFGAWEMSPDPGGLPRAPIKTVILVAFGMLLLQGIAQAIKYAAVLRGHQEVAQELAAEVTPRRPPDVRMACRRHVCRFLLHLDVRLPGSFLICRRGPLVRRHWAGVGRLRRQSLQADAESLVRHHVGLHPAGHPLFHLPGRDSGEIGAGRGFVGVARPAVRPGARGHCDRRRDRRHAVGGDDRRRGGDSDHDGDDVAARHVALRLRQEAGSGRHRGLGHAGATDPAEPGAHRPERPDRRAGGRHVPGGAHPRPDPVGFVPGLRHLPGHLPAAHGAGHPPGDAHALRRGVDVRRC